ncbi:MAG: histidine phosphatase family protein [Rhodothermaceae bacterium]|nr:histidine phosphatase family protein [Rhodothermaceae bacterium]
MPSILIFLLFITSSFSATLEDGRSSCDTVGTAPEIVAPGTISLNDRYEFGITLSRDCNELFIGVDHGQWLSVEQYVREGDSWRHLQRIAGSEEARANDPYLTVDGSRLYFILERDNQRDIVYVEREGEIGWSEPVFEAPPVNGPENEFYISFERNGDLIFASYRDAAGQGDYNLYRARRQGDQYVEVVPFPRPINTKWYEADPFIDPDGEFLLFASNRRGGKGRGDIYVSFHLGNEQWSEPVPITSINTERHELCPYITADGSTLYYTSDQDIYRVDASIIETYRPDELPATDKKPLKVFLVRHAEKVDQSRDSDLSEAGYQRAESLADVLRSANIEHVHSSDYMRTRKTASPVAELFGVDVRLYDPRNLPAFAEQLKEEGGVHLVVGHSNTTPALTELFGGEPGEPIEEKNEYDRLYLVTIMADGSVSSTLLRFGEKFIE